MGRKAVGSDIQSKEIVPFEVSVETPFNRAAITKVSVTTKEATESDDEKSYLVFDFVHESGERFHRHYEFEVHKGMGQMSEDDVVLNQDRKVAHLYNTFMGDGAHAKAANGTHSLGTCFTKNAEGEVVPKAEASWKEFFSSVAKSFNTSNKGGPVFKVDDDTFKTFWIKLTYDKNGKMQVPLFGNFVDEYREGVKCMLDIDPRYDLLAKPSSSVSGVVVKPNVSVAASKAAPKGFKGFKF